MKSKAETVKVAVRVRPMNQHEKEENSHLCVDVDCSLNQVSVSDSKRGTKTFQFDYVYPMTSTQREVYDQVAFPIVESIFEGYNGTVFAYGQTGCGKTFTMMGKVSDPNLRGVIPNAFEHIFGFIKSEGKSKKFLLRCSFVEIYNEEVRDLLGNNPNKALDVREDPKKGTYIKELSYTPLKDTSEIIKCLDKGNNNRHVGVTSMNDQSSRSHSLFTVYLEIEEAIDEKNKKIRSGKLNLVDLAGSERVGKTNATGQTFDEGRKINLSLTALGSVIDALSMNRKHIPYKDSKLTRLLSDSLGGNSKTVMFANVSPASYNYEETLGTLRYASRAKLIKNAPKINEDPKDALLRKYEEEIKKLKAQLEGQISLNEEVEEKGEEEEENEKEKGKGKKKKTLKISRSKEMNEDERKELLNKIAMLEKEVIEGGNKGEDNEIEGEKVEEINNFQKYRLQQLKNMDEMEKKYKRLQEQKRKEEEAMVNDANKMQKKIKYLEGELEDLKNENEQDTKEYFDTIRENNKDYKLYEQIAKNILNESEIRRIIDKSHYDEDNEKWIIQPFVFKEKLLQFQQVKMGQIPLFIEGELSKRKMVLGEEESKIPMPIGSLSSFEPKINRFRVNKEVPHLLLRQENSNQNIQKNDQLQMKPNKYFNLNFYNSNDTNMLTKGKDNRIGNNYHNLNVENKIPQRSERKFLTVPLMPTEKEKLKLISLQEPEYFKLNSNQEQEKTIMIKKPKKLEPIAKASPSEQEVIEQPQNQSMKVVKIKKKYLKELKEKDI